VAQLHGHILHAAIEAGMRAMSVPVHLRVRREGDQLVNFPTERIHLLLAEGFVPVIGGTLVRDDSYGWNIASADQLMAVCAQELRDPWKPRMAIFATDVDGLYDRDPAQPGAKLIEKLGRDDPVPGEAVTGQGIDVTGRMDGKVRHARTAAAICPTFILNGNVRGRVQDALKGKAVPGTRVN
jgi:isopentenyl phosphate kinase